MSKIIDVKAFSQVMKSDKIKPAVPRLNPASPKIIGESFNSVIRFGASEYKILQQNRQVEPALRQMKEVMQAQMAAQQFALKVSLAGKVVEAISQVFRKFQQQ
jgi:hypothetical protein